MVIKRKTHKDQSKTFRRSLLAMSIGSLISAHAFAAAPVPEADSGINILESNGVSVVEIVAPDATGLSHNKFVEYSVDESGLVLNNSIDSGSSQLAGELGRNSNFAAQSATVIVSEVTGSDPSNLEGSQEIFGSTADFILANPNGINVNGATFINTNQTTLTVGSPITSELGGLSGLTTKTAEDGAALTVAGSNETGGSLALMSPTISSSADSEISAEGDLSILLGEFDYTPGGEQFINAAVETGRAISVDATLMGAMTAGRINIVSTGAGVGVNLDADLTSESGILVKSDGGLDVSGEHVVNTSAIESLSDDVSNARHNAIYVAQGDLSSDGLSTSADDGVMFSSEGSLTLSNTDISSANQGYLRATANKDIVLNNVNSEGGNAALVEAVDGSLSVSNSSIVSATQVKLAASENITLNSVSLTNTRAEVVDIDNTEAEIFSLVDAGNEVHVNGLSVDSHVTQVVAENGVNLSSVSATQNLNIFSEEGNVNVSGSSDVGANLVAQAESGSMLLGGQLSVADSLVAHSASGSNMSGTVSADSIVLTSDANIALSGNITASSEARFIADDSLAASGYLKADEVLLSGNNGVNISSGASVNGTTSTKVAAKEGALNVHGNAHSFARLTSDGDLIIDSNSLSVVGGEVKAANDMVLNVKENVSVRSSTSHRNGEHRYSETKNLGNDCLNFLIIFNFCGEKKEVTDTHVRWDETYHVSSQLHAGNNMYIVDADRIDIVGSRVTAGNNATFITDEGDIAITHATNRRHEVTKRHVKTNSFIRDEERWDERVENRTSTHSSQVQAVSDLTLKSAGNVTVTGSNLYAGGDLYIEAAKDIAIRAANNTFTIDAESEGHGFHLSSYGIFGIGIGLNWTSQQSKVDISGNYHTASEVVGGSVTLTTNAGDEPGGDITIQASTIAATAGDLTIDSGRNFYSLAAYDSKKADVTKSTTHHKFEIGLLSIGFGGAYANGELHADKTVATTNEFSSAGGIDIDAEGDVVDQAGTYEAAGDITVDGENVTFEAVQNSVHYDANLDQFEWDFSIGLDVNGLVSTLQSWENFLTSVIDLAEGPKQSLRPVNNFDHVTNALGQDVERETVTEHLGFDDLAISGNLVPNLDFSNPSITIGIGFNANSSHMDYSKDHDKELGALISGNSVTITASNGDVNLEGTEIVATNDNVEITGDNINYTELEENYHVEANHTASSVGFNLGITIAPSPGLSASFSVGGSNYTGDQDRHTEEGGSVTAYQDALLVAEDGQITLVATNITAGDDIGLSATQGINIEATTNTFNSSQTYDEANFGFNIGLTATAPFINSLGFNASVAHEDLTVNSEYHDESILVAGDEVSITTIDGNVELTAPDIIAGGDVTIASQNGSVLINDSVDQANLTANSSGAGVNFSWSAPLTFGAGFHVQNNTHTINSESSDTSQIGAGGDATISSGTGVTLVGTDIAAGGDVTLDGGTGSVDIQASITDSNEHLSVNEFGFGFNSLDLGQSGGDAGIKLPGFNVDLDFQNLNIVAHTEKPGSVTAGGDVNITADGALNLHGTVITSGGDANIDTAGVNAQAAISTVEGGGVGFQLGLGVPSYTVGQKEPSGVLPQLPSFSTGFQYYEVDQQTVVNASINGTALNPSSEQNNDHEFGIDFGFGVDFSNANAVQTNAGNIEGGNDTLTNVAFGAAAIATLLTGNENNKFEVGEIRPGFGFQQSFDIDAGSAVEAEISSFFSDVPDFDFEEFTSL